MPQNIYKGRVIAFDKYLHWLTCKCKEIYIHCNMISVSVKKLDV